MTAILKVTDGTTSVNLVNGRGRSGFHLSNWRPAVTQFKNDGIWQDSPLGDGRRLADYRYANAIETFELVLDGHDQDGLAHQLQTLQRLLVQAADYWKSQWTTCPVWIEAQASCETNVRYAIIHKGSIPELDNTYNQPFLGRRTTMRDLTLIVERGHWAETAPGTGTAVAISNPGRAATTAAGEVFIANKHNTAAITDIYTQTAGGIWSANLIFAGLPFGLLPANVNNNDNVYFGITGGYNIPFCSLVFDIGTIMAGITGTEWRTHGGAIGANTWNVLTVQDNTDQDGLMTGWAFDTAGVKSVHWQQPNTWTPGNLQTIFGGTAPNISCMWLKLGIAAAGAGITPTQQNRPVYTILWPYVEVAAAQVPGDIPAVMKAVLSNQNANEPGTGYSQRGLMSWWIGLRSTSRGDDFTAFINLSDEQNPAGITITPTAFGAAAATIVDMYDAPSGRAVFIDGTVPGDGADIAIDIDLSLLSQYYGKYRVFLRTRNIDALATTCLLYVYFGNSMIASTTTQNITITTGAFMLADLGVITIPSSIIAASELPFALQLLLRIYSDGELNAYDLVLIPVDEWSAHVHTLQENDSAFRIVTTGGTLEAPEAFMIDAIGNPKSQYRALGVTGAEIHSGLALIPNGISILQNASIQRLWMLQGGIRGYWEGSADRAGSIQLQRQARYLGLRGAR